MALGFLDWCVSQPLWIVPRSGEFRKCIEAQSAGLNLQAPFLALSPQGLSDDCADRGI
jgi:hypothetical protein